MQIKTEIGGYRKMKMGYLFCLLGVVILGNVSGCQKESGNNTKNDAAGETKHVKVALTIEDILKTGPGKFAGERYDKQKVKDELYKIPKNATDEEVFNKTVALIGEDFQPEKKAFDQFNSEYKRSGNMPGDKVKKPEIKDTNIAILLDSSGSMSSQVSGGQKMEVAKHVVQKFTSTVPKEAKVSLTVYGHKGSNSEEDKKESCSSIEEIYPLNTYDKEKFQSTMQPLKPKGWTPLAAAIREGKEILSGGGAEANNVVFVVSDGLETCGGDPAEEAKQLAQANVKATVNIIGFDVNNQEQQELKKVAEAGNGTYFTAQSKEDLEEYFDKKYHEMWMKWWNYKGEALEGYNDQRADKTELILELHGKVENKKGNELDRFVYAIDYLNSKGDFEKLNTFRGKRYDTIDRYFSDLYIEASDEMDKNYLNDTDELENEAEEGMDSAEDKERGN